MPSRRQPGKFSGVVDEFASSCAARADGFAKVWVNASRMRLSTSLIVGLSAAYLADFLYFGGAYGMAAMSLFRHVGLGILAGFGYYG
jgi:hypothetical protein